MQSVQHREGDLQLDLTSDQNREGDLQFDFAPFSNPLPMTYSDSDSGQLNGRFPTAEFNWGDSSSGSGALGVDLEVEPEEGGAGKALSV